TDQGSEVRRLAFLELLGKRYRFLSDRLPWDVDEFALSPDGRWIAVVTNEDGVGALHVLSAATGVERRLPKLPAVLIGNLNVRPGFLGRNNYYLIGLGVALIFPNVRGSTGHGKTFAKLDNGTLREGAYRDIGALLDWIRTRADLDADHVLVTGGSYGGHMTL